jgi:hypothetical protein
MVEKRIDMYKVRNIFEALAGFEACSAEGDHALGWEPKSSERRKRVYLAQRTFQTLETLYKSGSSFPNQIRIFHGWKVHVYLKRIFCQVGSSLLMHGENLIIR